MKKSRNSAALTSARPLPPAEFIDQLNNYYMPAPDVLKWARATILTEGGTLYNEDHAHLEYADVQFLWAPMGFVKAGRTVLGQCEEVTFRCGPWQKGRQQQQMVDWFGAVPDFLITLDASYCLTCSDAEFCALLEHELYHIALEVDDFGAPAFNKYGCRSSACAAMTSKSSSAWSGATVLARTCSASSTQQRHRQKWRK